MCNSMVLLIVKCVVVWDVIGGSCGCWNKRRGRSSGCEFF